MKTFIEWMEEKDPEFTEGILDWMRLRGKKKKPVQKTTTWSPKRRQTQAATAQAGTPKWVDVKGQPEVGRS